MPAGGAKEFFRRSHRTGGGGKVGSVLKLKSLLVHEHLVGFFLVREGVGGKCGLERFREGVRDQFGYSGR